MIPNRGISPIRQIRALTSHRITVMLPNNGYIGGGMQQEVVLAMLAKEPSQGYQLRARLNDALGPLGEALNAGQVYVTLGRLEKAGLVAVEETPESTGPAD